MDEIKFRRAESDAKISEVLQLGQPDYPSLSPSETGELLTSALKKDGYRHEIYYYQHNKTGQIISAIDLVYNQGSYKNPDKGITLIPNIHSFGVNHITVLQISKVLTAANFRATGIGNKLLGEVIDHVEKEIVESEIDKSKPEIPDSFAAMVKDSDGRIDKSLANYYLSKKYFWVIHSAVGSVFERFGFKSYEMEMYKIPVSIVTPERQELINALTKRESSDETHGKTLQLLDFTNQEDLTLISFAYNSKEMLLLTEMNKLISHTELNGGRKSSSSLTNVSQLLNMTTLSSIQESDSPNKSSSSNKSGSPPRRKSSVTIHDIPKFSIKPDSTNLVTNNFLSSEYGKATESHIPIEKYRHIRGAVLNNQLQNKSYFIIWSILKGRVVILGVGDLYYSLADTQMQATTVVQGLRRPSFTGVNELGGINFQDLDILFSVAASIGLNASVKDKSSVYIAVNDLPGVIPLPVLNDYFLSYLPKTFEKGESASNQVELLTHGGQTLELLPMLRPFGSKSNEFELDWIANSPAYFLA